MVIGVPLSRVCKKLDQLRRFRWPANGEGVSNISKFTRSRGHWHPLFSTVLWVASKRSAETHASFKPNFDGDWIAGRKRFCQRVVKQFIQIGYRVWTTSMLIFGVRLASPLMSAAGVCPTGTIRQREPLTINMA